MKRIIKIIRIAESIKGPLWIGRKDVKKLLLAIERLEYIAFNDDMHTGEATIMARQSFPQEEATK